MRPSLRGMGLWLVLFAPAAAILWPVTARVFPPAVQLAPFTWVYLLAVGLFWAESMAQRAGHRPVVLSRGGLVRARASGAFFLLTHGSGRGWLAALLLLIGMQVVQAVVAVADWSQVELFTTWPLSPKAQALLWRLGWLVVAIGFIEELWFRGLWFQVSGGRFVLGVVLGAVLFGLYHAHLGPEKVLMTFAIGLGYGVARWVGAPVVALALVHGLMDWFNSVLAPAQAMRVPPDQFALWAFGGFVVVAAIIGAMFGPFRRMD